LYTGEVTITFQMMRYQKEQTNYENR